MAKLNPEIKPLHWLGGFIADLPTPFEGGDKIDWPAFEMLCEHQIGSGATAIVVGETMGEASTLERIERAEIISTAVAIARGRIAVIAGAGSNSTGQAIELTAIAESNGADAILSVAPYYNKPMQTGILAHFQAIAGSTGLPIILHDIPSRTVRGLADETIVRLAASPTPARGGLWPVAVSFQRGRRRVCVHDGNSSLWFWCTRRGESPWVRARGAGH